ncbi:D-methionine-binding lipoprotein MetQ [Pseudoclavibacter chungangensis]|uniref:D-methionine-binding lipoprotein MetQ n=1 Tax=Pseudoclavibacter chungangensis TaxID=587635 RepID=A0A7J5BNS0_9MICO|nr:MetQ/NlpA family ABC transporter substrate-binding protein [Pseudoclavibacter chungangensis]KAB1654047.1 D-methionine-binding lipoprotein MetQ [Pseudoclavibacter chungangensis]NYJ66044.1 D-methionine transport system substrate-binding protein [Pseudoclavibacter chungangensis]
MKPRVLARIAAVAAAALVLAGCSADAGAGDSTVIKVAAATTPMTDIVRAAGEAIGDGYTIELVEVADYVQPNVMLEAGEIDANFIQHVPFMEEFNTANGASLVGVQPVYLTMVSFYSKTLTSIDQLPQNGTVTLPQDRPNTGRALEMLKEAGIISLDPAVEKYQATLDDVTDNPRNLQFNQVELLQLNAAYEESDAVFNLPAFARQIGLDPFAEGLTLEEDPQFAVTLVTRADNQDSPEVAALKTAFTSEQVKAVVEEFGMHTAF